MDMMEENGEQQASERFIPVRPGKRRRLGIMFSQLLPGALLLFSVTGKWPSTPSSVALFVFSLAAGLALVVVSIRSFLYSRKPAAGTDLVVAFTGFVLIAQGSNIFSAVRGVQPAHLLLLTGIFYVFRGVLFPGDKSRQGFHITEEYITYRRSAFSKSGPVPRKGIVSVSAKENVLVLVYTGGEARELPVPGADNPVEASRELGEFLRI